MKIESVDIMEVSDNEGTMQFRKKRHSESYVFT